MGRRVRWLWVRLVLAGRVALGTEAGAGVAMLWRPEGVARHGGGRHALRCGRLASAAPAAGHPAHWKTKQF